MPRYALALALLAALLSACAAQPPAAVSDALFADALFPEASEPIGAAEVFTLSPAMQDYLRQQHLDSRNIGDARQALVDALYNKGQLKLAFDASRTRTAAQAFAAKSGNCISLVIMTAAFADALGLPVQFQAVEVPENWNREGRLLFSSGHVNLHLPRLPGSQPLLETAGTRGAGITIDFQPPGPAEQQRSRVISRRTLLAMYLNNRAAEALADGALGNAYHWARAAVLQDPTYLEAANTLAVVYSRHGNHALAEQLLRRTLAQEPDNLVALSNLALVLHQQGRRSEAERITVRVEEAEPYPPYHFFDLGKVALNAGNAKAAKFYFAKEVQRAAYNHEFHFWLAVANLRLGEDANARQELAIALENSTTSQATALYSAKLDYLNSGVVRQQ